MRDCVDQVSPWAWLRWGFLGYFNGGEKIYSLWGALFSGQGVLDCLKQAEHQQACIEARISAFDCRCHVTSCSKFPLSPLLQGWIVTWSVGD